MEGVTTTHNPQDRAVRASENGSIDHGNNYRLGFRRSDAQNHGEIVIDDQSNTVEWLVGSKLVRKFCYDEPVVNAGFLDFERSKNCLVILLEEVGHVYHLDTGDQSTICFPFPISNSFCYDNGLILERKVSAFSPDIYQSDPQYKYITLMDPSAPFGTISVPSNQLELLRDAKMILFAEKKKNHNFTVLYNDLTREFHIFYTRILNQGDNSDRFDVNGREGSSSKIIGSNRRHKYASTPNKRSMSATFFAQTTTASSHPQLFKVDYLLEGLRNVSGAHSTSPKLSLPNRSVTISSTMDRLFSGNQLPNDPTNIIDPTTSTVRGLNFSGTANPTNGALSNTEFSHMSLERNPVTPFQSWRDLANYAPQSRDVSLVRTSTITLTQDAELVSLKCVPLSFGSQEAIAIFDRNTNFGKIWMIDLTPDIQESISFKMYGNAPPNSIKLVDFDPSIFIERSMGGTVKASEVYAYSDIFPASKNNSHDELLILVYQNLKKAVLYCPFADISSPPQDLTVFKGTGFSGELTNVKVHSDTYYILKSELSASPFENFTKSCFDALQLIVPMDVFYSMLFIWRYVMNQSILIKKEKDNFPEFTAFEVLLKILLTSHDKKKEIQPDRKDVRLALCNNVRSLRLFNDVLANYSDMFVLFPKIIMGLHLLREELLLNVLRNEEVTRLSRLLHFAVYAMNWPYAWKIYYDCRVSDNGEGSGWDDIRPYMGRIFAHPLDEPPSILKSLYSITEGSQIPITRYISFSRLVESDPGVDRKITPRSFKTLRLYEIIHSPDFSDSYLLDILSELQISREEIETYPLGIYKPLKNMLQRLEGSITQPDNSLNLSYIFRPDLKKCVQATIEGAKFHKDSSNQWGKFLQMSTQSRKGRKPRAMHSVAINILRTAEKSSRTHKIKKLALEEGIHNPSNTSGEYMDAKFTSDPKYKIVQALLNNSLPQKFSMVSGAKDYAVVLGKKKRLLRILAFRMCTTGIGFGAMTYSSESPLSTQRWYIPRMNRLVIFNDGTKLSISDQDIPVSFLEWGSFHTGVASALKISTKALGITGSWIAYNRPQTLDGEFGGFLLGLGLNGHLRDLEEWHIYNYLSPKINLVSVGLLLGMSASSRKSKNPRLFKVLSVHVVALLPRGSNDLNIDVDVQMAALLGIGLLLQGSQNKDMSKLLCGQLLDNMRMRGDSASHECYRIAVGISLGLINLGFGETYLATDGTVSLNGKGNDRKGLIQDAEDKNPLNGNLHLPDERMPGIQRGGVDRKLVQTLLTIINLQVEKETALVFENSYIGTILSIMLIFLRTENATIANKLRLNRDTKKSYCKPELFMYREWAYYMIMWDTVGSDMSFILQGIDFSTIDNILSTDKLPIYFSIAGRVLAMGIKFSSTGSTKIRNVLISLLDRFLPFYQYPGSLENERTNNVDFKLAIKGINVLINTLIVATAFVMSATGDLKTLRRVKYLHEVVTGKFSDMYEYSSSLKSRRKDINMMTSIPDISAEDYPGTVNGGSTSDNYPTGGVGTEDEYFFGSESSDQHRYRREMEEIESENHYGKYLATSMALGMLFLGSGQYALNTSSLESVAYLILSVLPLYMPPYSLQELRHFWSMAVEQRYLVIRNAVTEEIISGIQVEMDLESSFERPTSDFTGNLTAERKSVTAPCLLPDIRTIRAIRIHSRKYYPLDLQFDDQSKAIEFFRKGTVIYIQPRECGNLVSRTKDDVYSNLDGRIDLMRMGILSESNSKNEADTHHFDAKFEEFLGFSDTTMVELDSEMKKLGNNPRSNQSKIYNLEILCSDENSGNVVDYEIELWKKKEYSSMKTRTINTQST